MAPASASAKALQQNRARPRAVVPVIPLPYIQKRQQQEAARAKAREAAVAPPPVVEAQRSPIPPVAEITTPVANVSSDGQVSEDVEEVVEPESPSVVAPSSTAAEEERKAALQESEVTVEQETAGKPQETPPPPSEAQSSTSRSTYHMPPAFVPATPSQTDGNNNSTAPSNNVLNGHYQAHHPHPSVNNVMFGGFPESARSSPAPHFMGNTSQYPQAAAGGGYGPPPPLSNGSGHAHHMSNGYSPMAPSAPPGFYPRQENHGPAADNFGRRQMISFGPPEGYSPSATPMGGEHQPLPYDPLDPRFHGGPNSFKNDYESSPAHYGHHTAVVTNRANGHVEEVRLHQQHRPKPSGSLRHHNPLLEQFNFPMGGDSFDGLLYYLQQHFGSSDWADYVVELRYSDDRAPPARIPAHGLLLSRSLTLKRLMIAHTENNSHDGQSVRTLLIQSDDRYLRSDAFWMATHRLYGAPLLDSDEVNNMASAAPPPPPCPPTDRFTFALAYASAGKLLDIHPVTHRGIEVASTLLSWNNIEVAFDFALDGGLDQQWEIGPRGRLQEEIPSTYGPSVNFLIHHAMQFVIANFPAAFVLDTTVDEPMFNRRLPTVPQAGQNPRLSSIKFGDHPSEEHVRSSENPVFVTLSKLLLNLPWDLLKYILESSNLGNVQGWATTALRHKVMNAVVEEREKRRIKVLENTFVSNEERKAHSKQWRVVGYMEKVEQVSKMPGNDPVPTITKKWVDYTLLSQN